MNIDLNKMMVHWMLVRSLLNRNRNDDVNDNVNDDVNQIESCSEDDNNNTLDVDNCSHSSSSSTTSESSQRSSSSSSTVSYRSFVEMNATHVEQHSNGMQSNNLHTNQVGENGENHFNSHNSLESMETDLEAAMSEAIPNSDSQMTASISSSSSMHANSSSSPSSSTHSQQQSRTTPIVHAASEPPICPTCEQQDNPYFNPQCVGCLTILEDSRTTIAQIFAIMRQWLPQTQKFMETLIKEILKRGAHVDDRDGLTDMTLLHYACKAGSRGVGDKDVALRCVRLLVETFGADISIRCRWTDMSAIHYAVYFDVSLILEYLLQMTDSAYIDETCRDFDGGTPLHMAASNICLQSAKILLKHDANVLLKDDLSRTPLDCVPDAQISANYLGSSNAFETLSELRTLFENATLACMPGEGFDIQGPVTGKVVLQALGLNLGDRVIISNTKVGTLRYCGATQFATSIWAGVKLKEPEGKNDGTVGGITYFRCPPKHGIFAPVSKIAKFDECHGKYIKGFNSLAYKNINFPSIDVSRISPKVETGLSNLKSKNIHSLEILIGDRVMLMDKRVGRIVYIGDTQFAPGIWYGIELEKPLGKNDGSVNGVHYFTCKPQHGVFASASRILKIIREGKRADADSDETMSDVSLTLSRSSTDDAFKSPIMKKCKARSPLAKISCSSSTSSLSSAPANTWLTVGVNVFINNNIGVVRYIGPVDFADGIWLGIELRTPSGKNDGCVQGKRYFTCKPNHGIVVRPKKVSVRGINGAKLLPDEAEKK